MSQNIDTVPGETSPQDRNQAQNQRHPTEATATSSSQGKELIDLRGDSEILDPRFPPLQVLQMMNNEEYLQYQKEFLKMEREAATGRAKQEIASKAAKIKQDIPIYGRECYGFRCLAREQQVDFVTARLNFNIISSVIRYATSTKAAWYYLETFQARIPVLPYTLMLSCLSRP